MFEIKNNEKNKSAVILSPEAGVKISGASVESVINDGDKTKRYSAKRDLYGDFAYAQPLKMTDNSLSLSGASSEPIISAEPKENQPRYSVNCQAIPKYDRFYFGFAKVLAFAFIFTLVTTAESSAECRFPDSSGNCRTLKTDGGTCGTGCSYTYDPDTKTVYITATGNDARIGYAAFHRNFYENDFMPAQTFVINGAVGIGPTAIIGNQPLTVSGADGALVLTGLGQAPIGERGIFSGTIIIPEGATFAESAFHGKFAADAKIYCNVENCEQKMIEACGGDLNLESCKTVSKIISKGQLFPFPDGCAVMGATGCTKCKNSNFKLNAGECDRLRWTPAEAAKVLTDDNNNSVTITFKK